MSKSSIPVGFSPTSPPQECAVVCTMGWCLQVRRTHLRCSIVVRYLQTNGQVNSAYQIRPAAPQLFDQTHSTQSTLSLRRCQQANFCAEFNSLASHWIPPSFGRLVVQSFPSNFTVTLFIYQSRVVVNSKNLLFSKKLVDYCVKSSS